jgi:Flp pilus assembly protein TadG
VEFVLLSVGLLVPLVYLLVAAFTVQRTAYGVEQAAREAARGFVNAPSSAVGAVQARAAARVALANQGVDPATVSVEWTCGGGVSCLAPGSQVVVRVDARVALPGVPMVLGHDLASVPVHAEHVETVDRFQAARS